MSIIRSMREESEVIKFDNLFTNDLENEREFDLIFTAEQDDEDLKTIAGNAILKEDGSEIEFNLPDCIAVNEDGEVVDKDEEAEEGSDEPVEDISSNDTDGNGVDDDIDAATAAPAPAPSVVVNVDADDVNINAADPGVDASGVSESESEAENNNVGMTINADTVNMTVGANAPAAADVQAAPPTVEPAAVPTASEEEIEVTDDEDVTPIGDEADDADNSDEGDADVAPEEPATPVEAEDKTDATPDSNDEGEPTATAEAGMEDVYTPSQLEDILNTGIEPAPAPEVTTPENEPVDPSTEVVFSDTGDQEVQEAAEPTKEEPITPIDEEAGEIEAVKNDENLEPSAKIEKEFEDDLSDNVGDEKKVEDSMNNAPEDEVKKELDIEPVKTTDVPMNDGSAHEAAESSDDVTPLGEEDDIVDDFDDSEVSDKEIVDDTEAEDEGCKKECGVNCAAEPTKEEPVTPIEEAEIEAVKNDENLETAKKIEGEFEDDIKPIADADVEKILNDAPEDETKEDLKIDPVEPKDVPMNDGSVKEAAEPTKEEPVTPLDEADDPTEGDAAENGLTAPMSTDPKHTDTSANSAIEGKNNDEVEDAATTVEDLDVALIGEASEDEDPMEKIVDQDAEDSLLGIEPSLTAGDLAQIYADKKDDPDKVDDGKLAEAAEPTKEEPVTPIEEADACIDDADPIDANDIAQNTDISPIGPDEVVPDEVNAPDEDMEYDKVAAEKKEVAAEAAEPSKEDPVVPRNEAAEPTKEEPVTPIDEADFMDQVNAMDNGESFADVMNTGLNVSPEEVEPGSDDELIDDEIIEVVESEDSVDLL